MKVIAKFRKRKTVDWTQRFLLDVPRSETVKGRRKRKYDNGWTLAHFEQQEKIQHGHCAICNKLFTLEDQGEMDHKHCRPPLARALLCGPCNTALGMLGDSPETCEAAAQYLRHWDKPCKGCGRCLDCLREERADSICIQHRIAHCMWCRATGGDGFVAVR